MEKLNYFDVNGIMGYPLFDVNTGLFNGYSNSRSLLKDMDYFGIDNCLVSHYDSRKFDPMTGNYRLMEEISTHGRLYPCWVVIPTNTQEKWQIKNLIKEIKKNNVRAVRFLTGVNNFSLELDYIDNFLSGLQNNGVLLIIEYKNLGVAVPNPVEHDMVVLDEICSKYPKLNIISSGPLRQFYILLKKHKNLFFSLEWEPHSNIIEDICSKFGPEKILFGTPNCEISSRLSGAVISMLTYSNISISDKQKIAGVNLAKLLGFEKFTGSTINNCIKDDNFKSKVCNETVSLDYYIQKSQRGESFNKPIIDCHYHVGEFAAEHKPGSDLESAISLFKRGDLDKIIINSSEAVIDGNHRKGNDYIYSICKKFPEYFIGFYVFNPNFLESRDELVDYIENKKFMGIKIHPRIHKCDISDDKYKPVWEAAAKYNVLVLSHTGEGQAHSDPMQLMVISKRYPNVIFILGHGGESFKGINQSIEIVNSRDNVFIDISGWGFMHKGVLEYVAKNVGADKLVFGSDTGWIDFNFAVGVVAFSDLSKKDKEKILGKNIKDLFHK